MPYKLFSFIENPFGLEGCPLQSAEAFDADFRGNHEFFLEGLLQTPPKGRSILVRLQALAYDRAYIRVGFFVPAQFDDELISQLPITSHDLFHLHGIELGPPVNNHIIGPPEDSPSERAWVRPQQQGVES